MKSFKEYLTESVTERKLTLRFATEMSDEDVNRIERFLGKYDLISISRTSTTPITQNPLFFSDEVKNTKVSKMDIVTSYPIAADVLRQQLSDLLPMNMQYIAVRKFIDGFLASLSKRDEVTVENELSIKPKSDTASDMMDTDEKSSPSVITGDEE